MADILEIVHALADVCGVTMHQVEQARLHKKSKRGGFTKKLYAAYATAPDGSLGHAYYNNNQHKHPAIPLPPVNSAIHELE